MSPAYRRRPLYSACNEDTRSEIRALEPGPGDIVVSIASGGGRALSLLSTSPRRLIAIDQRIDQVINLELKAAAMEALDCDTFRAFLGQWTGRDREDVYASLRPALTPSARRYWDARRSLIREGVLYGGRTERALRAYAALLRRCGLFSWPARLFDLTSLEEQLHVLRDVSADVRRAEMFWSLFVNPVLFFAATQDPSFLRSTYGSVGRYLYGRLTRYMSDHLVRESFLAHLIYNGHYSDRGPLPIYLERSGFELAKKNLAGLEIVCSRVEDAVGHMRLHGSLKWSLSDVSSWMSEPQFHEMVRTVCSVGEPGSRICARNFAAHRSLPNGLGGRLRRLDGLCEHLDQDDSSMFYRFEAGEYVGLNA